MWLRWIRIEIGGSHVDALGDPSKLIPLLAGPGGAIAALLLFIGYLLREVAAARGERKLYLEKYEQMRESRDEFRFLAGDAVRAGKRAAQTAVVTSASKGRRQEGNVD